MNSLEIVAVITALIGIIYTILENRLCWLVNILASLLYFKVFYDSNLPGQMLLQLLYVLVGVYGYSYWGSKNRVKIKRLGKYQTLSLLLASLLSGYLIFRLSVGVLWADASITIASIIATYLTTRKYIENWTFWLIINLASIGLFIFQELKLTAALYLVYATLSIIGQNQWSKQLKILRSSSLVGTEIE